MITASRLFSNCINVYAIGISALLIYIICTYHREWIGLGTSMDAKLTESHGLAVAAEIDEDAASNKKDNGMGIKFVNSDEEAYSHPLDPFTTEELKLASKLLFDSLQSDSKYNAQKIYMHSYWPYLPSKAQAFNYLEKKAKGSLMPKFDTKEFPHKMTLDVSFVNGNADNNNNGIREYYNIVMDLTNSKIESINKLDTNNFKGFPMITAMDFEVGTNIIISDSQVFNYFHKTLGMTEEAIKNNILCFTTAPIVDYLKLMQEKGIVNSNHRFSFPICFDFTFTAEYSYQNQLPFLGILDLDNEILIDYFDCHDLNVPCKHYDKFNLETFEWSDAIMSKEEFEKNTKYKDVEMADIATCQQERYSNKFVKEHLRPKIEFDFDPNGYSSSESEGGLKPSFEIANNHEIFWQGWSLHESFNIRFGGVLSDIRFNNRSIVYNMHLSEIYVPYQTNVTSLWWYSKFYLDGSQYGVGWYVVVISVFFISCFFVSCLFFNFDWWVMCHVVAWIMVTRD